MSKMACAWAERHEVFEEYVKGTLSLDDRVAFEDHYFVCDACYEALETHRALRAELRTAAAEIQSRPVVKARAWRWALVPAAASLVLVAAVVLWRWGPEQGVPEPPPVATSTQQPGAAPTARAQPTPAPAVQQTTQPIVALNVLARVEPPVYIPVALRGPRDEAVEKLEAAMRQYAKGNYAAAIPGLRAAADLDRDDPQIAFFLAVCHLLTNQTDAAVTGLRHVVALGDSPYLEEAHFYLAKAMLRQGDVRAARQELQRVIDRRGWHQEDARQLLAQLDSLPEGKDRPPNK